MLSVFIYRVIGYGNFPKLSVEQNLADKVAYADSAEPIRAI